MEEYIVPADLRIAIKSTYKANKWCSARNHPITYIVRDVHKCDQGRTPKQTEQWLCTCIIMLTTLSKRLRIPRWNYSVNSHSIKLNLKTTKASEKQVVVHKLDGYQLIQVTMFKHLGFVTGSKDHIDEELNGRIKKYIRFWNGVSPITTTTCIQWTETSDILRPIPLYGHECRILTKELKSKITAAQIMKVLRLVEGVPRRDRVPDTDIYEEFKTKSIIKR